MYIIKRMTVINMYVPLFVSLPYIMMSLMYDRGLFKIVPVITVQIGVGSSSDVPNPHQLTY